MTYPSPLAGASVRWSFLGVAGVRVQCPLALDNGVARVVGQTYRADLDGYALDDAPHVYVLPKREAARLRTFFAKALHSRELRPGDAATAAEFGLPFPSLTAPAQE